MEHLTFSGLDSVPSMELLNILRRLCNNGHLVIITTKALPGKTAELFHQLILLSDKQVSENCGGEPRVIGTPNPLREDHLIPKARRLEDRGQKSILSL